MKKIIIFFTFLFFTFGYCQIVSGKVTDSHKNPVAGARIGIEETETGVVSGENGNFQIDFSNTDKNTKLKIYVSGFLLFTTKISDFINSNHEIMLTEKVIEVEPIAINPKKYTIKNFGTKTKSKGAYCGYDSNNKTRLFREYAIQIKNKKHLKIKTININIAHFEVDGPAVLIFDVQGSKNGFPDDSKSLTNEALKLTVNKKDIINNKVSLDVADKSIWIDEDFFVLVRVEENLKGKLYFSGNVFAFSKDTYFRNYFGEWKKFSTGEPSINVDVQIER